HRVSRGRSKPRQRPRGPAQRPRDPGAVRQRSRARLDRHGGIAGVHDVSFDRYSSQMKTPQRLEPQRAQRTPRRKTTVEQSSALLCVLCGSLLFGCRKDSGEATAEKTAPEISVRTAVATTQPFTETVG